MTPPALEVLAAGALTTVQDLGRPGYAALGVTRSGAFDRAALRLANRLVGNDEDAAGLEALGGGLELQARTAVTVAVTGAPGPVTVTTAGRRRLADHAAPLSLPAGARLHLGTPTSGLRRYLALAGGIGGPRVLTSRSRDTLAALGPEPLRATTLLERAGPPGLPPGVDHVPQHPVVPPWLLRLDRGPRTDRLAPAQLAALVTAVWTIAVDSNRVGVRLSGTPLSTRGGELVSEALVPGAIQIPPGGLPVIMGPDHPTTGGYPVVAVVDEDDLDRLAQARPGDSVSLRWR